jgi:serine protease AprX
MTMPDTAGAISGLALPERLDADARFRGRGVTIGIVDAGFHPHPDLVRPANRIRVWADATREQIESRWYDPDDVPVWPEMHSHERAAEWHGLMTSVTAAGNGWLSDGRFRGIASESDVALVRVGAGGAIAADAIARGLRWLRAHADDLRLRVVSLSIAGDEVPLGADNEIDDEVEALTADGVVVVAAAGNDGIRRLLPPATSVDAITVGGLDDHRSRDCALWDAWHSNYGAGRGDSVKPEIIAPSVWTIAPVLPGSDLSVESRHLFLRHNLHSFEINRRIADLRLVTPHYHFVEGTSVAAPIVASIAACMIEANPDLTSEQVKTLLMLSASRLRDVAPERQGAGAVNAARAVAAALANASSPRV